MHIAILGSGALGSYIGAILCQKHNTTLIGRENHINAIRKNGLIIYGKTNLRVFPNTALNISKVKKIDLLILTTKSYDTEIAMKNAKNFLNKKTTILSMQNGIGNYEKIWKATKKKPIIGLFFGGTTLTEYGKVFHAGTGEIVFGEFNGKITKRVKEIAKIFSSLQTKKLKKNSEYFSSHEEEKKLMENIKISKVSSNFSSQNISELEKTNNIFHRTRISKNIKGEIFAKAIINSCINPLTAIFRVKNGILLKNEKLKNLMEEICREGIAVAKKSKISLPYDVLEKARQTILLTAENKSSMLQDIERGKRTEINEINGEIIKQGKKLGVKTELNEKIVKAIKEIERWKIEKLEI